MPEPKLEPKSTKSFAFLLATDFQIENYYTLKQKNAKIRNNRKSKTEKIKLVAEMNFLLTLQPKAADFVTFFFRLPKNTFTTEKSFSVGHSTNRKNANRFSLKILLVTDLSHTLTVEILREARYLNWY